jgi:hypothetical protein
MSLAAIDRADVEEAEMILSDPTIGVKPFKATHKSEEK